MGSGSQEKEELKVPSAALCDAEVVAKNNRTLPNGAMRGRIGGDIG